MIHYALPTTADLLELGAPRADALSIYLTTDPTPAGRDLAFTTAKSAVDEAIRAFQKQLNNAGMIAPVRRTRGDDIDAACGQLKGQVMDRTRRSERYIAVRELNAAEDLPQIAVNRI